MRLMAAWARKGEPGSEHVQTYYDVGNWSHKHLAGFVQRCKRSMLPFFEPQVPVMTTGNRFKPALAGQWVRHR
jgi:hypothetical protein